MNANRYESEANLGISILKRAVDATSSPADLVPMMTSMALVHILAAKRIAGGESVCPGCSHAGVMTDNAGVLKCTGCGGFYTSEAITMDEACRFVNFRLAMADSTPEGNFYFDFVIERDGQPADRVHGWACRKTKRVTQWG